MNHPNRDEWVPFIFGETEAEDRRRLKAHLQECAHCRAQVDGWRQTVRRLDRWQVPVHTAPAAWLRPALSWAAAAALILGIGFAFGLLWSRPSEGLKAALVDEIRMQVQKDWEQRLALASLEAANASTNVLQSSLGALWRNLEQQREQDVRTLLAMIRRLEQENAAAYLSLRKDLETVASLTETEIQQARQGLFRLAAHTRREEKSP